MSSAPVSTAASLGSWQRIARAALLCAAVGWSAMDAARTFAPPQGLPTPGVAQTVGDCQVQAPRRADHALSVIFRYSSCMQSKGWKPKNEG